MAVGALTTAHLLAAAALTGGLFVFVDAAGFALLPAVVGRSGLPAATARLTSLGTVVTMAGPAVGGVLVAVAGPAWVLALDAVAHACAAGLVVVCGRRAGLAAFRPGASSPSGSSSSGSSPSGSSPPSVSRAPSGRGVVGDAGEALAYLWRQPLLRSLTGLGAAASVSAGAVTGLVLVVAVERLGLPADDPRVGWLFGAVGVGSALAAAVLPWLQRHLPVGVITLGGFGAATLGVLAWSLTTDWLTGVFVLAAWQAATTTAVVNGIVIRQVVTPVRLQGRVNTTARMIAWGGTPVGASLGGRRRPAVGSRGRPGAGLRGVRARRRPGSGRARAPRGHGRRPVRRGRPQRPRRVKGHRPHGSPTVAP